MSAAPKTFLNSDKTNAVNEFIEGLLLTYPNSLQRLEGHDVILAKPLPEQKVVLLSGGGSGHEPSHAGWVGKGMLTGAVCGGIFASPSVNSILAAIRAVTPISPSNEGGCLLIVKNYTGDRLNFGLACERANAEGRRTKMIVVADDCAIPRSKGVTGARGVAGTVLVHKVAGAAAARGMSLDQVTALASLASSRIRTLGVALDAVTLPTAATVNDRLAGSKMEIGLGIHGEAGIRQCDVMGADDVAQEILETLRHFGETKDCSLHKSFSSPSGKEILSLLTEFADEMELEPEAATADEMLKALQEHDGEEEEEDVSEERASGKDEVLQALEVSASKQQSTDNLKPEGVEMLETLCMFGENDDNLSHLKSGDEVLVMVNNLGGSSNFELSILARSVIKYLEEKMGCVVWRAMVGTFMTSFNMHGASVSVMCLHGTPELGALLDDATEAPAWTRSDTKRCGPRPSSILAEVKAPESTTTPTSTTVSVDDFETRAKKAISAACAALIDAEPQLTEWDTVVGDGDCGQTMARGAKEVSQRLDSGAISTSDPAAMYVAIADAVSASMGGTSGVLFEIFFRKSATYLSEAAQDGAAVTALDLSDAFVEGVRGVSYYGQAGVGSRTMMDALVPAAEAAHKGVEAMSEAASDGALSTAAMKTATAGRSNYLSEDQLDGIPDPGAKAIAIMLKAIVVDLAM